jgi:hypothetical protein
MLNLYVLILSVNAESPLTEKIRRVIRGCKQALDLDSRINRMGE